MSYKYLPVVLVLTLAACSGVGSTQNSSQSSASSPPNQSVAGAPAASTPANRRLELSTFFVPTPNPDSCNHDTGTPSGPNCDCPEYLISCENSQCTNIVPPEGQPSKTCGEVGIWCQTPSLTGSGSGTYCVGKPVIYLYPPKPTLISVTVQTSGTIVASMPTYGTGWQNVLANPSGELFYQAKTYKELFYETSVANIAKPSDGIVIPRDDLLPTLTMITSQLGLTVSEQQEFLKYWLPKLDALNSPYVLFSVIDPSEKNRIDHVVISPKPDTDIEFLAYFRPLQSPISITPLTLPAVMPQRVGFTAVEWGGTIDTSSENVHF